MPLALWRAQRTQSCAPAEAKAAVVPPREHAELLLSDEARCGHLPSQRTLLRVIFKPADGARQFELRRDAETDMCGMSCADRRWGVHAEVVQWRAAIRVAHRRVCSRSKQQRDHTSLLGFDRKVQRAVAWWVAAGQLSVSARLENVTFCAHPCCWCASRCSVLPGQD